MINKMHVEFHNAHQENQDIISLAYVSISAPQSSDNQIIRVHGQQTPGEELIYTSFGVNLVIDVEVLNVVYIIAGTS